MEQPHPNINQANLYDHQIDRVALYGLWARIELAGEMFLNGYASEELDDIRFVADEETLAAPPAEKQRWLDRNLAQKITEAEAEWDQTRDETAWHEFKQQISLWYQKGLIIFDLLTSQDIRDFERLHESDPVIQRRFSTDAMSMQPSLPDADEEMLGRAHP